MKNKMKNILFLMIIFSLSGFSQTKIKPSQISNATKQSFKEVLDINKLETSLDLTNTVLNTKIDSTSLSSAIDQFYTKTQSNYKFINQDRNDTITTVLNVPTPAAGTNTTQVANTAFVNNAVAKNNILSELQLLGVNVSTVPYFSYTLASTATHTMVDGTAYVEVIRCLETKSYSGVGFIMNSPTGNYTSDNWNGFVLFSISGGIMTEIARTADTPNLWKATAASITNTAFETPVTLTAGNNYAVVGVWNASGVTTAPVIQTFGTQARSDVWVSNIRLHGSLATQNTIPSTYNFSSFANDTNIKSFFLY